MRLLFALIGTLIATPLAAQQTDSLVVDAAGKKLVLRDLGGFPRETVSVKHHDGPPERYSGVTLRSLLERAGMTITRMRGAFLAQYIVVEARDGYRVSFGIAELDTALVSRQLFVVDSLEGRPLAVDDGPWRLIVAGDQAGARSVRMVSAIRVREPE